MSRKPIVHLAYTVPLGRTRVRRALDKALRLMHVTPLHRFAYDALIPWQHPIRAPHSITHNLLDAIRARGYDVRLYSLYEHTVADIKVGDIFIGQPVPRGGFGAQRSHIDDPDSVTSRTIREFPSSRNFIIMPYAHDAEYSLFAKDLFKTNATDGGGAIFIGGAIWERDWKERSPLADIGDLRKIHLTAMGVDARDYPTVKTTFNPKGKRKYLYIGHTGWYKNAQQLERIAAAMPGQTFIHVGGGELHGWENRGFASLTPEYMRTLAEECDIFINVSTSDPQATTIVEQMCFGFAIACTPETGYDYPALATLRTRDTDHNVRVLQHLQHVDEEALLMQARENRRIAEEKHGWAQFTDQVLDFSLLPLHPPVGDFSL